jgi:hypothetical protein
LTKLKTFVESSPTFNIYISGRFTVRFSVQSDMGLDGEQVNVLKRCFDGFADEEGAIPADNVGNILSMMGLKVKPSALKEIIEEIDEDGELNKTHFGKRKEGRLMSISLSCRFWIARIWRVLSTGSQIPD